MSRSFPPGFFERQAEQLSAECGLRKEMRAAIREWQKKHYASRINKVAKGLARNVEADLYSDHDKRLMRALHTEGISVDEIARKWGATCLEVVLILDRYV